MTFLTYECGRPAVKSSLYCLEKGITANQLHWSPSMLHSLQALAVTWTYALPMQNKYTLVLIPTSSCRCYQAELGKLILPSTMDILDGFISPSRFLYSVSRSAHGYTWTVAASGCIPFLAENFPLGFYDFFSHEVCQAGWYRQGHPWLKFLKISEILSCVCKSEHWTFAFFSLLVLVNIQLKVFHF